VKVFTLRFDPRIDGFDDGGLREFLRDKETLSIRDSFFVKDESPYWGVMVTYNVASRDGEIGAAHGGAPAAAAGKDDYRSLLREEDRPLFNALRDWRSARAKSEGVPPYLIVTNDVLARVVRERPPSLSALGAIRGMGEARIKRHGRDILATLGRHVPPPARSDDGGACNAAIAAGAADPPAPSTDGAAPGPVAGADDGGE
jgi:hypothetical protein